MKFKASIGTQVMVKGKILTITAEEYETKCEDEIKALKGARKVEELKASKAKSQK